MKIPKICVSIINSDLSAVKEIEPFVDLLEVRIDLIGNGWPEVVRHLEKPWLACNRLVTEGGNWQGNEEERINELFKAADLGASIIDIELATESLSEILPALKTRARCLLSFHDLEGTPPLEELKPKVTRQLQAGADICKVITTAKKFEDNLITLQLIANFPKIEIISFAMGDSGYLSRVLCPLVGGQFTYASIKQGKEAAAGQITVKDLLNIYEMVRL